MVFQRLLRFCTATSMNLCFLRAFDAQTTVSAPGTLSAVLWHVDDSKKVFDDAAELKRFNENMTARYTLGVEHLGAPQTTCTHMRVRACACRQASMCVHTRVRARAHTHTHTNQIK